MHDDLYIYVYHFDWHLHFISCQRLQYTWEPVHARWASLVSLPRWEGSGRAVVNQRLRPRQKPIKRSSHRSHQILPSSLTWSSGTNGWLSSQQIWFLISTVDDNFKRFSAVRDVNVLGLVKIIVCPRDGVISTHGSLDHYLSKMLETKDSHHASHFFHTWQSGNDRKRWWPSTASWKRSSHLWRVCRGLRENGFFNTISTFFATHVLWHVTRHKPMPMY